jgi:hypothetical protein
LNAWFLRGVAAALWSTAAQAAPTAVEPFDARTWQALLGSLQAPAAVVFTTTDCAYCPQALQHLAAEIGKRRLRATLIAVVMDAAPGEADARLIDDPHYHPADRLLAFAGPPAALRHTVNPGWRGVTPYVAFLRPGAPPTWVTGAPTAQAIAEWAEARPPAGRRH